MSRKTTQLSTLAIATVFLLSACSHVYYAPNGQNVPLLKEQGELQISGASAGSGEGGGANIQGAYAITNNVGVVLNSYIASGENDDSGANGNGFAVEGGAGWFKPINDFIVFESYAGVGGGSINNNYADNTSSKVSFVRPYIQPAIGFTSNYVDLAFATRFAMLNYTGISRSGMMLDSTNNAQLNYIGDNKTQLFFEPGVTLRAGWKYVKFQFQYVWSVNLNNNAINRDNHNVSLGLMLNIAPRFKAGSTTN